MFFVTLKLATKIAHALKLCYIVCTLCKMEVITLTNPHSDQQLYVLLIWCKPNTCQNNFKLHDKTGKHTAPNLETQIDNINKTAVNIKNI